MAFKRFLSCLIIFAATWSLHAQSDTLVLNDGRVLVGNYKVAQYQTVVENRKNYKEFYRAKNVKSLSTSKTYYRAVDVKVSGEPLYFMAERLLDSEVDLYGAEFPIGYFSTNSVEQSFFFFEREGVFTYVNKANLEAFYTTYFGNCYGWIPDKKLLYNENSIANMLNAYNRCLNPNAAQKVVEPTVSDLSVVAFGGIARLHHYPLNVAFNDGEFKDHGSQYGLGVSFVIKHKIAMGIEIYQAQHMVASPVFVSSYVQNFSPTMINSSFKALGMNLTGAYVFLFNKLSIQPGMSVGFGKIYDYTEAQIQPDFYINYPPPTFQPNDDNVFAFEELYYHFKAFIQINYGLSSRIAVLTRGGADLSFTKSLVGTDSNTTVAKEGNHAIDGVLFELGLIYKLKN